MHRGGWRTDVRISIYLTRLPSTEVAGDNAAVVVHWVLEVIVRLAKVRKIPTKKPIHIFEGFKFCSAIKFKEPFSLLFNQDSVTQINMAVGIFDTSAAMLVRVKSIWQQEVTSYHYICTLNDWLMQKKENSYWNCGWNHGLRYCQDQKNQKVIESNENRWEDDWAASVEWQK